MRQWQRPVIHWLRDARSDRDCGGQSEIGIELRHASGRGKIRQMNANPKKAVTWRHGDHVNKALPLKACYCIEYRPTLAYLSGSEIRFLFDNHFCYIRRYPSCNCISPECIVVP